MRLPYKCIENDSILQYPNGLKGLFYGRTAGCCVYFVYRDGLAFLSRFPIVEYRYVSFPGSTHYPGIIAGDFNDTPSSCTCRRLKGGMTDGFRAVVAELRLRRTPVRQTDKRGGS